MEKNYEYRFELKPGKFVYLPTDEGRIRGKAICAAVRRRWIPHPIFFHLARRGGHVAALHLHKSRQYFARHDLVSFFGSVTRTKVARSLRRIGFDREDAFWIAHDSVVKIDGRRFLPYGFVQSMALATLALEKSALGAFLTSQDIPTIQVSVYVDDITLSSSSLPDLEKFLDLLQHTAKMSGFELSAAKFEPPSEEVHPFNCVLGENLTMIEETRIKKLEEAYALRNGFGKAATVKYIEAISPAQAADFLIRVDTA